MKNNQLITISNKLPQDFIQNLQSLCQKNNIEIKTYFDTDLEKINTLNDFFNQKQKLELDLAEYKNLYEASKIINSTLKIDEALKLIISLISEVLQAKTISIMLIDQTTNELVVQAAKHNRNIIGARNKIGKGISGKVAESGIPIFVPNPEAPARSLSYIQKENNYQTKSFMCVPLKLNENIIGVINVTDKIGKIPIFGDRDRRIIMELASQMSIAIENAKLYTSVEVLALQDALTKLYNRNFFQKSLADEIQKANVHDYAVSLVMLDIDFFKSFNDTYGHQVGDIVLKKVADVLKTSVRKTDIPARYGGEEMIGILVGADAGEALSVAEKIRTRIENLEIYALSAPSNDGEEKNIIIEKTEFQNYNFLHFPFTDTNDSKNSKDAWLTKFIQAINSNSPELKTLKITVSLGVSSFPQDLGLSKSHMMLESASQQDLLIYMADKALYKAKKYGRNRTLTYSSVQQTIILNQDEKLENNTIHTLLEKIKIKDSNTYYHLLRVSKICELIAQKLNLRPEEQKLCKIGGLLHDIGKIKLSDKIIKNPQNLSWEENQAYQTHPTLGSSLINSYPVLHKYINAIRLHHENFDGTGFPEKLSGTRIPIEARVIALANDYDAMTSKYIGHSKLDPIARKEALKIIEKNKNARYDSEVVNAFLASQKQIKKLENKKLKSKY